MKNLENLNSEIQDPEDNSGSFEVSEKIAESTENPLDYQTDLKIAEEIKEKTFLENKLGKLKTLIAGFLIGMSAFLSGCASSENKSNIGNIKPSVEKVDEEINEIESRITRLQETDRKISELEKNSKQKTVANIPETKKFQSPQEILAQERVRLCKEYIELYNEWQVLDLEAKQLAKYLRKGPAKEISGPTAKEDLEIARQVEQLKESMQKKFDNDLKDIINSPRIHNFYTNIGGLRVMIAGAKERIKDANKSIAISQELMKKAK